MANLNYFEPFLPSFYTPSLESVDINDTTHSSIVSVKIYKPFPSGRICYWNSNKCAGNSDETDR